MRRGWSLTAAAIRDGRPGHSRHGIFPTPQGVPTGWSLSAAAIRDGSAQGTSVRKLAIRASRAQGTGKRKRGEWCYHQAFVATLAHAVSGRSGLHAGVLAPVIVRQRCGARHGAQMCHVRAAASVRAAQGLNARNIRDEGSKRRVWHI